MVSSKKVMYAATLIYSFTCFSPVFSQEVATNTTQQDSSLYAQIYAQLSSVPYRFLSNEQRIIAQNLALVLFGTLEATLVAKLLAQFTDNEFEELETKQTLFYAFCGSSVLFALSTLFTHQKNTITSTVIAQNNESPVLVT